MRHLLPALTLIVTACNTNDSPYDRDYGITKGNINAGAPKNDSLPNDNKADEVYPATFQLPKAEQSPVQDQGSRGVCSIFAATAIVENLYLKAGAPVADVDFSEQYMQWLVKRKLGAYVNDEGSNVDDNLKAVVQFGDIKEAAWRYESKGWTTANDPACTGAEQGLPTRCYTNGEPPPSALAAPNFKLPGSRWINTNSIKAHLTAKKSGVGVGLKFFYQAWNYPDKLPVDDAMFRRGEVTNPNQTDITESEKEPAGHAIMIVGWDDNKAVPMRDAQGKPVRDAQGNPMMEKGFFLFKNSWGADSFGVDHPYGAGYGWLSYDYVADWGSAAVADVPNLNQPDSPPSGGGTMHAYSAMPSASIPDNSPTGASSAITVSDNGSVTTVKVTTDITHTYRGDLKVTLTHGSTSQVIFDGAGGSADDLKETFEVTGFGGAALSGGWTLQVVDTAAADTGTLNSWKLEVTTM